MPAGRPSSYDPLYCEAIVEHCQDGASISSFAASIGVARSTINEWASNHPEFSEAVKRAKTAVAAWYDKAGRKAIVEGGGNATLVIFGLKNFDSEDFRDVKATELTGKDGGPINVKAESAEWTIIDTATEGGA